MIFYYRKGNGGGDDDDDDSKKPTGTILQALTTFSSLPTILK